MSATKQNEYPMPTLPQAVNGFLDRDLIRREGVKVTVPVYSFMQIGDQVSTPFKGSPQTQPIQFPVINTVTSVGPLHLTIPVGAVDPGWENLEVNYSVGGKGDSPTVHVLIR